VNLLLQSINDWSRTIVDIEEFLKQIRTFLGGKKITIENLESALGSLSPARSAWEMESLSGLIELLRFSNLQQLDSDTIEKIF